MKLTKKGLPDRRCKFTVADKEYWFWRRYGVLVIVGALGFLSGTILMSRIWKSYNRPVVSPKPTSELKKVKEVVAAQTPYCYDPITCLRDIGEEMGFSNKEIITAIKIGKCESGLNPQFIAHEPNGTYSLGVMQINDVHGKRISRADRLDFEKNIRFAWTLRKEQGHWGAWSCFKKIL